MLVIHSRICIQSSNKDAMQRIVRKDLGLSSFCLKKKQDLLEATRAKRLTRAKELLNVVQSGMLPSVLWTDEKLFSIQEAYNPENSRVLGKKKSEIPMEKKAVVRKQGVASVMVWAGVTCCGKKTPLIFIDKGVKINKDVYLAMLRDDVLPWLEREFGDTPYVVQQDGASSHTAKVVQEWCAENFSGIWPKSTWPPAPQCHGLLHVIHP